MHLKERLQRALGSNYTVQGELGGGGMSRVFKARDETLGRDIVIKILMPDLAAALNIERFTREIRLVASLQQANIVPVLSAGAADGLPYYSMPFIEGLSLRERMQQSTPARLSESVRVLGDVARALEYAHDHGVVHRDIKPENVLLSGRTAVVTDFGIAKAMNASAKSQGLLQSLTGAGTSLGTPGYMAPEQAAGDKIDARVDLYAWGVVAYELLTGKHPFPGKKTTQQLIAAQISERPRPIDALRRNLPVPLASLIMRALEKDPANRPQSAGELIKALDDSAATVGAPGIRAVVSHFQKIIDRMRLVVCALALLSTPIALRAQQSVERDFAGRFAALATAVGLSDSIRLHRLFDLDWEYNNVVFPEYATYTGYPGQNDRWTDLSVNAITLRRENAKRELAVVRAIDRAHLSDADRLSYDIFRRGAEEAVEGQRFPAELLQISQRDGPQYAASTIGSMPTGTINDYANIIARLRALPTVVDQTIALLDSGIKRGITPPRITLRDVPAQMTNLIPEDPDASALLAPFNRFPAGIAESDRGRLRVEARRVYDELDRPTFHRLRRYLETAYIPRSRETIGMSALPDGAAWYAYNVKVQTTTTRTPKEIHELGLSEVKRIRGQMDSLIAATAFRGEFAAFTNMLRTDPKFFYSDSAALVRAYRDVTKRIDPELPRLFGRLPRLTYGVETIPSYAAPSQTTAYYQPGSPDAHRAGQFFVNTYKLDTRPIWEMEVLTAHEAVPGHHLQIAIAQELEGIPNFRRYGGYTAFVEGWALYSESLGPELGLYKDPYSKFGQLTYEMWRAVRLVIDTGIHYLGWTRQQAIDYFRSNSAKTDQDIIQEVDRYIVWPGQALAYKSGELQIKALRKYAEQELGARFDIRAFHDQILGQGALPLDVLDTRVRAWVARQKGN
ncbi:MAG: DUF885 family protein [Gemmatimonadaceae bacterium]